MGRTFALSLLAVLAVAANAFAIGEGRIQGKITDAVTKKPVANAVISFQAITGRNLKQEYKADKDGVFRFLVLDATLRYKFTWSAPGYQPYSEEMKLKPGDMTVKDIELVPASAAAGAAGPAMGESKADPAIVAYNAGAALANDGKNDEAIAKFEEAATQKADFIAAYQALAKTYARTKNWDKAIENANKALAIDADDTDMHAILAQSYEAKGQKDKAAESRKKLPADAGALFNEAARLINAGKDKEAEPLLKQAIAANDKLAPAYYELGMLYVRISRNADAKTNLEKYLDLDPNGKESATAKEMLKYVK